MDGKIIDRNISKSQLDDAVRLHREELQGGFLSSLGDRALRLIFEAAAQSKSARFAIYLDSDGEVRGFLLGALSTGAFYKDFLIRKGLKAMILVAPSLLSVRLFSRAFETLTYPLRAGKKVKTPEGDLPDDLPTPELLDIAVSKRMQGQGVGQQLFHYFVEQIRAASEPAFKITTGDSLTGAQRFYEKLGAEQVGTIEVHAGEKTVVYVFSVDTA